MNKWIGIGRLTAAPEIRRTPSGKAVGSFSIAIDDGYGENKTTDFIDIVVWDKTAENCGRYLDKGSKVAIVGKLKKRSYEKNGSKVWVTEVVASEVEFVESKPKEQGAKPRTNKSVPSMPGFEEINDDGDLPF